MAVLTGIDVIGIQSYVFASNRLRDVLAASWMVDHVTSRQQLEQWPGQEPRNVLLAAGGTAIVEFENLSAARNWTALYTRWLVQTAPGLEVVVVHRPREKRPLAWALKALHLELGRKKLERRPDVPQLGLSVTAPCAVTGLPATADDRGDLVSPRVEQLRKRVKEAKDRWNEFLPALEHAPGWSPEFPDELDLMGRTHGETSLLGVVHVDGNSVGEAIRRWLDRCVEDEVADVAVRNQYHDWSREIVELGKAVLRSLAKRTAEHVRREEDRCVLRGTPYELGHRLYDWRDDKTGKASRKTVFLPLRPILLGGDDLTFACDGRVALDLAVTALKEYQKRSIPHLAEEGKTLTACAGVALVKAHAPLLRSYELVEDLCRSAKRARMEKNENSNSETGCWLDWHVGSTRPRESVEDVRRRQYLWGASANMRDLTMRPYPLGNTVDRRESWEWFDNDLLGPRREAADDGTFRGFKWKPDAGGGKKSLPNAWSGSRSRVKRLGSLVAEGGARVENQVTAWKVVEEGVQLPGNLDSSGFIGSRTPLRDAIELLDLHMRLEPDLRTAEDKSDSGAARATTEEDSSS